MTKPILNIDGIKIDGDGSTMPIVRSASGSSDLANSSGRIIRYVFSDPSVGRDGHTIASWKLGNFKRNPVFLWAHQSSDPPIGRVLDDIVDVNGRLSGSVEYAERDAYPFADTIFQLVRGRYINAVSTSWDPIDWKFSGDAARPRGAVDFKVVDLLEISQVPVPALPTALATARSNGIDTGPLYEWAGKVLDSGDMLLIPRKELELLRREAKMPKRTRRRTGEADADAKRNAQMLAEKKRVDDLAKFKRGMYEVARLAMILSDLDSLEDCVAWEASIEGDESPVPDQLREAMKMLGDALVAMTTEEVAEMGAEEVAGDQSDFVGSVFPISSPPRIAAFDLMRKLDEGALSSLRSMMTAHLAGKSVVIEHTGIKVEFGVRAGKVLSGKNEKTLRDAHEMMTRGCDMLRSVFDAEDAQDGGADEADEAKRAQRQRKARALKLKVGTAT